MNDIDESTGTTKRDPDATDKMMPSEALPESKGVLHPWVDDSPASSAPKPRRKTWKILVVVLALLVAASAGWYVLVFRKTPSYAFKQIKKAYDTHDIELFNQYVDVDAFCQQTVDDYTTWVDQNDLAGTATDVWSELGKTIAESMIQSMKPQMVTEMKKNLLNSVEDTGAAFANSTFSLTNDIVSMANPRSFINETPLSIVKTGKVTTLKFTVFDSKYNKNLEIDLLLRNAGTHLQVVRMGNFAEWLDSITRLEQLRVDRVNSLEQERVKTVNAATAATMEKTLSIQKVNWKYILTGFTYNWAELTVSANLKNAGNKPIARYGITLTFWDSSGKKMTFMDVSFKTVTDIDIGTTQLIKTNSSVTVDTDLILYLDDPDDKLVFDSLKKGGMTFTANYSYIQFTDGTELNYIQFEPIKKFQ